LPRVSAAEISPFDALDQQVPRFDRGWGTAGRHQTVIENQKNV
jgi:hypothetical protein